MLGVETPTILSLLFGNFIVSNNIASGCATASEAKSSVEIRCFSPMSRFAYPASWSQSTNVENLVA